MAKTKSKKLQTAKEWVERVAEINPEAITLDGFESCVVGMASRFGMTPVLAYDYDQCIEVLVKRDGMDYEEAVEFFEFNTIGGWFGEGTPVFVNLKL